MKEIVLSNGGLTYVDDADYDKVSRYTWSKNGKGYVQAAIPGFTTVFLHRVLMGAKKGEEVDHINRKRFDNRRSNLRIVKELILNRPDRPSKRVSLFRGVTFLHYRNKNRWRANIARVYLGMFPTQEEAARAYDEAAKRKWGEFAPLNFPDSVTA